MIVEVDGLTIQVRPLCEQAQVIYKPGMLYYFLPLPGCPSCEQQVEEHEKSFDNTWKDDFCKKVEDAIEKEIT